MRFSLRYIVFPLVTCLPIAISLTGDGEQPHPTARTKWDILNRGDYLREEYIRTVCETRSPLKGWRKAGQAIIDDGLQQITIEDDENGVSLSAGYNFHEGSGPFHPLENGTLELGTDIYSIDIKGHTEFVLTKGKTDVRFRYVGDWQRWANRAVIAGTYEDKHGSYDYIYSDKLKSTWAVVAVPNGIALYDVDLSRNEPEGAVAAKPRWELKRLSSQPCSVATQ